MSETPEVSASDTGFTRAAARRYLANEHGVIVRTIDRHYVAVAVLAEAEARGVEDQADIDIEVIDAAIEQIKSVRPTWAWPGEEPICGAEPEDVIAGMGCKPCSLPAGHDQHRYPYPMPARPEPSEAGASDA